MRPMGTLSLPCDDANAQLEFAAVSVAPLGWLGGEGARPTAYTATFAMGCAWLIVTGAGVEPQSFGPHTDCAACVRRSHTGMVPVVEWHVCFVPHLSFCGAGGGGSYVERLQCCVGDTVGVLRSGVARRGRHDPSRLPRIRVRHIPTLNWLFFPMLGRILMG